MRVCLCLCVFACKLFRYMHVCMLRTDVQTGLVRSCIGTYIPALIIFHTTIHKYMWIYDECVSLSVCICLYVV